MLTMHAFGNRVLTADLESSPAPLLGGLLSKLPDDDFRPFQSRRKPLDLCGRVACLLSGPFFFGGMKSFFDKR